MEFNVAGVSFYKDSIEKVISHTTCSLIPEPDNEHDKEAIQVIVNDFRIGYVPRNQTQAVRDHVELPCEAKIAIGSFHAGYFGNVTLCT